MLETKTVSFHVHFCELLENLVSRMFLVLVLFLSHQAPSGVNLVEGGRKHFEILEIKSFLIPSEFFVRLKWVAGRDLDQNS